MKKDLFLITIAALLIVLVSSCGSTCKMANKNKLTSNSWELSTINGSTPDLNQFRTGMPFLLFGSKGKLTGSTGCNNMAGNYTLKKACLELEPGAITRMACQGNGETLFLDALKQVKMMKSDGDKLILLDGTKEIMTLVPKK
jgi:heat shock protein HslJ